MKIAFFLLSITVVVFSCKKENDPSQPEDPNWIKLEIPDAERAYSVIGNIDDTLLVSTYINAYYTCDKGKTWHESKTFNTGVYFIEIEDTIFTVMKESFNYFLNKTGSSTLDYYTLDFGKKWERYKRHKVMSPTVGNATSSTGKIYSLKYNFKETHPNTYSTQPTDILIDGNQTLDNMKLPFRYEILNLYIDSKNRLYITAAGGEYDETSDSFIWPDSEPAVIYISKKPNPEPVNLE
jgi:hypothetical protein